MNNRHAKSLQLAKIALEEKRIRSMLESHGVELVVSTIRNHGYRSAFHWQFNGEGERLLDYWPTSEAYWNRRTGERGKALSADHAANMAISLLNKVTLSMW